MAVDFSGRDYARFNKRDLSQLLFTCFAVAIIFFMYKWKSTDFSYNTGVSYFIFIFVIILGTTFLASYIQKRYAISQGYLLEYENNTLYIIAGIIITFLFEAYVLVIVPGMVHLVTHPRLRLGHFRPLVHIKDAAIISLVIPIVYFCLFIIAAILNATSGSFIFKELMRVMIVMVFFFLVPAPQQNGLSIYRWSVTAYIISLVIALAAFLIAFITEPWLIIGSLLGAAALTAIGLMDILPRIFYGA